MKVEKSFKSRIRNAVAGGLVTLLTFLPIGCGSLEKVKDEPIRGYAETSIVSDWVIPSGDRIARRSSQSFLSINKGPISGNLFHSNAIGGGEDSGKQEIDSWITYTHSLTNKLSLSGTFMNWTFPVSDKWRSDYLVGGELSYNGFIDARFGGLHMFAKDGAPDGESISGKISKAFPIGKIAGAEVSVAPEISMGYTRDMYGIDGFRHVSPGISVRIGKGSWNINGFVRRQLSLNDDTTEQFTYGGVGIGYGF